MLTPKDFANNVEIKWCPGCGDHAILKHLQSALAKSGSEPHMTAIISGIGCASRLPYYMNTYGFHTIHGRAFPIATGLKLSRPELDVWVITGDGDALSIGGNHYLHLFRRDIDLSILLFNNHVYGLTKGQFSPTSSIGQISKTSPSGSIENPINALNLALTSGARFIARTFDRDAAFIQQMMMDAKNHKGSAIIEILQNCPIFNDGVFDFFIGKSNQPQRTLRLEHGKPLTFGSDAEYAIVLNGFRPTIVATELAGSDIWIHDQTNQILAELLCRFGDEGFEDMPLALGVIYQNPRQISVDTYSEDYSEKLESIIQSGKFAG